MRKLILLTISFLFIGILNAGERYDPYGHFWYSEKQYELSKMLLLSDSTTLPDTYCVINGEVLLYTQRTKIKTNTAKFNDIIYLGYGYTTGIFKNRISVK